MSGRIHYFALLTSQSSLLRDLVVARRYIRSTKLPEGAWSWRCDPIGDVLQLYVSAPC